MPYNLPTRRRSASSSSPATSRRRSHRSSPTCARSAGGRLVGHNVSLTLSLDVPRGRRRPRPRSPRCGEPTGRTGRRPSCASRASASSASGSRWRRRRTTTGRSCSRTTSRSRRASTATCSRSALRRAARRRRVTLSRSTATRASSATAAPSRRRRRSLAHPRLVGLHAAAGGVARLRRVAETRDAPPDQGLPTRPSTWYRGAAAAGAPTRGRSGTLRTPRPRAGDLVAAPSRRRSSTRTARASRPPTRAAARRRRAAAPCAPRHCSAGGPPPAGRRPSGVLTRCEEVEAPATLPTAPAPTASTGWRCARGRARRAVALASNIGSLVSSVMRVARTCRSPPSLTLSRRRRPPAPQRGRACAVVHLEDRRRPS